MRLPAFLLAVALALAAAADAAAADAAHGQELYELRCGGCHSLDANRVGPAHRGVYGRKAGSAPNFNYSTAVKNSTVVWEEKTLDAWLTNPQALIPGQRMNFRVAYRRGPRRYHRLSAPAVGQMSDSRAPSGNPGAHDCLARGAGRIRRSVSSRRSTQRSGTARPRAAAGRPASAGLHGRPSQ